MSAGVPLASKPALTTRFCEISSGLRVMGLALVEQGLPGEVFRIGHSPEAADEGAGLIKQGVKTGTSSLLWVYQATNKPLPEVGSLSIVTNGHGDPVCVVETITVEIKGFAEVDAAFAYDYGEWDRTLETWRAYYWAFNAPRCHALKAPTPEMPLVCERFIVVYP
jgi:uncharacterized protein YhfF